jgi:hypothetical protein
MITAKKKAILKLSLPLNLNSPLLVGAQRKSRCTGTARDEFKCKMPPFTCTIPKVEFGYEGKRPSAFGVLQLYFRTMPLILFSTFLDKGSGL